MVGGGIGMGGNGDGDTGAGASAGVVAGAGGGAVGSASGTEGGTNTGLGACGSPGVVGSVVGSGVADAAGRVCSGAVVVDFAGSATGAGVFIAISTLRMNRAAGPSDLSKPVSQTPKPMSTSAAISRRAMGPAADR